jgi:hypothetical protein
MAAARRKGRQAGTTTGSSLRNRPKEKGTLMLETGNLSAGVLARFARENLFGIQRAAFRIRYSNDETVAVAVFGNDNYSSDEKVREEVGQIRQQLKDASIDEIGFGLSPDGITWALLLKVNNDRYQTAAGRAFQVEMVKAFLDEVISGACRAAGELSPDSAVWLLKNHQRAG